MSTTIPIIIVNWNGINDTLLCIRKVLKMSYTNFHVFLIDNGSHQNEVEELKAHFLDNEKITLVLNEDNLGFTRATNKVLKSKILTGNYDYVAMLNNDAFPEKDWLENILKAAKETNADMVSSMLINHAVPTLIDNTGHFMLNTGEVIPDGFGQRVALHNKRKKNAGACAGAALYNVKMLQKIGIFDEYFHTGYEDAEFGIRALITGHTLIYEPTAVAYHKMSASVNKIRSEDYMVKIQSSIFYTYLKLMPLPVILINLPFIVFRTIFLFGLFIVFRRPSYIRIYRKSLKQIRTKDWAEIKAKRNTFFNTCEVISSLSVMQKQRFFLWDNIRRFFLYFVKGERTIFEKTNDTRSS